MGLPVTQTVRDEAEATLAACNALLSPAERATATKWLAALGPLVAGNMPASDALMRLTGYVEVIEAPPMCFTRKTLKIAAARFKWFPSVSELSELFDEITAPTREIKFICARVAAAKVSGPVTSKAKRANDPAFIAAMEQWEKTKAELAAKSQATKGSAA